MSYVVINALDVPEDARSTFEERFANRQHAVDDSPGFEGFKMLRPVGGPEDRYLVYTQWASKEDYEAWRDGVGRQTHKAQAASTDNKPAAAKSTVLEFELLDM